MNSCEKLFKESFCYLLIHKRCIPLKGFKSFKKIVFKSTFAPLITE